MHLKRFVVEHQENANGDVEVVFHKNKAPVELSTNLSLDKVSPDCCGVGQYSLCSFVRHQGAKANSGHYTAVAMRRRQTLPDKERKDLLTDWVCFDDSRTAITSLDAEVSKKGNQVNAYMCLYILDDQSNVQASTS